MSKIRKHILMDAQQLARLEDVADYYCHNWVGVLRRPRYGGGSLSWFLRERALREAALIILAQPHLSDDEAMDWAGDYMDEVERDARAYHAQKERDE